MHQPIWELPQHFTKLRLGLSPLVLPLELPLCIPPTRLRTRLALDVLLLDANLKTFKRTMLQEHLLQLLS